MKLISYRKSTDLQVRTGVVLDAGVLDLSEWMAALPICAEAISAHQRAGSVPPTAGMLRWLCSGSQKWPVLQRHVSQQQNAKLDALNTLVLYAPVPRPGKIIGVGRNYADHAKETGVDPFEKPRIIFKMPSSIAAPGAPVARPAAVSKLDFEAELAVIIGGYGKHLDVSQARSLVAGYTVLNDVSAREFQFDVSPAQTTFAKSMDTFAPMGPWLITADEVPDPQNLEVFCWLNGQAMQHGHTRDMLFSVDTLIAYLSQYMTLEPGDVITTGTPAGIGAFRKPPLYLQPGDRLRLEVSGVGRMEHEIVQG